jgi:putative SOS response-associated peptidase YedK
VRRSASDSRSLPETYSERYNLAPQQRALIVRGREGERDAVMAKWGLLPHWAKDAKIAFKMINARAETLGEKPAYRSLLPRHRCLVPADGFYEWTVADDGKKTPVYFQLAERTMFAFAGLWASRTDPETGEVLVSCTIVTTTPNELVAPVHDRMPVILPAGLEAAWLDPSVPKEQALALLEPYPAALMTAAEASRDVNSVKNDFPGLLVPDGLLAA